MRYIKKGSTIREAFDIRPGEVISLTGGGGKTTLMFAIAKELSAPGGLVITTCTTKMYPPSDSDAPHLFISRDEDEIIDHIRRYGRTFRHMCLAREREDSTGKLKGLEPEVVARLSNQEQVSYTIVEADGAAKRPLKAPDIRYEPVIPQNSSLVVPVAGMDGLGEKLEERVVFRAGIASRLTEIPLGEVVSPEMIATLLIHPLGLTHGSPETAGIIPFLNKTDLPGGASNGRDLACRILEAGHPRVKRVVTGHARQAPVVEEIIE